MYKLEVEGEKNDVNKAIITNNYLYYGKRKS